MMIDHRSCRKQQKKQKMSLLNLRWRAPKQLTANQKQYKKTDETDAQNLQFTALQSSF